MNSDVRSTSLQPNSGSLQQGQTNLQPQSGATQSTGSLQQDVLGPDAYRAYDGSLSVDGGSELLTSQPVAAGSATPEIFLGIFLMLVVAAVVVLRRYRESLTKLSELESHQDTVAEEEQVVVAAPKEIRASSQKKKKSTAKKATNKKVTKKKTTTKRKKR